MTGHAPRDAAARARSPAERVPTDVTPVTIRHARPADADALAVLAKLDSSHPPQGAVLVAAAGGELWAAVSLDDTT